MVHARTHDPVMTVIDHAAPISNRYATGLYKRRKTDSTDGKMHDCAHRVGMHGKTLQGCGGFLNSLPLFGQDKRGATPRRRPGLHDQVLLHDVVGESADRA
jgi:hypothetical protein